MERFIAFVLAFEAGLTSRKCVFESNLLRFQEAKKTGWSDDPRDLGGATMCGVTLKTYKGWCSRNGKPVPTKAALRNIPYSHWSSIVKEYWDLAGGSDLICEPVAWLVADWVWASGPKVLKSVQMVVNSLLAVHRPDIPALSVDGIIGRKSKYAMDCLDGRELFDRLKEMRVVYVERNCKGNPSQKVFRNGWLRRIEAITFEGLVY